MTENEIKEFVAEIRRKSEIFRNSRFATTSITNVFDKPADIIEELLPYMAIGTIEEFKDLKEKNNEHYSDTDELDGYGYTCTNKTCVERIRNKAIDEFAELMKEKLKDMQFAEFQGIDVCPCAKTGEECPYINQDIGCQYCAREQTIKKIDEISEQMKAGDKE